MVHRLALSPLSHTSQGFRWLFIPYSASLDSRPNPNQKAGEKLMSSSGDWGSRPWCGIPEGGGRPMRHRDPRPKLRPFWLDCKPQICVGIHFVAISLNTSHVPDIPREVRVDMWGGGGVSWEESWPPTEGCRRPPEAEICEFHFTWQKGSGYCLGPRLPSRPSTAFPCGRSHSCLHSSIRLAASPPPSSGSQHGRVWAGLQALPTILGHGQSNSRHPVGVGRGRLGS